MAKETIRGKETEPAEKVGSLNRHRFLALCTPGRYDLWHLLRLECDSIAGAAFCRAHLEAYEETEYLFSGYRRVLYRTPSRTMPDPAPGGDMVSSEKPRKTTAIRQPYTKAQLFTAIAEDTGLSRKDVMNVFESLAGIMHRHLKKRAVGLFSLPGLCKFSVSTKKATRDRKGINPFTGEETVFKAKPARRLVKIRALKGLKDMLESP